jgi:hypothetical protein
LGGYCCLSAQPRCDGGGDGTVVRAGQGLCIVSGFRLFLTVLDSAEKCKLILTENDCFSHRRSDHLQPKPQLHGIFLRQSVAVSHLRSSSTADSVVDLSPFETSTAPALTMAAPARQCALPRWWQTEAWVVHCCQTVQR